MKYSGAVVAIAASLSIGLTVAAQEGRGMGEGGGGMAVPPPGKITSVTVPRTAVKTIKTEVSIVQAVRRDAPDFRGEGLFFQRCSLCHLGEWRKAGEIASYAPSLKGVLKDPSREQAVRMFVQNGSVNMPGFRQTFTPTQFEDLMAYLKTL